MNKIIIPIYDKTVSITFYKGVVKDLYELLISLRKVRHGYEYQMDIGHRFYNMIYQEEVIRFNNIPGLKYYEFNEHYPQTLTNKYFYIKEAPHSSGLSISLNISNMTEEQQKQLQVIINNQNIDILALYQKMQLIHNINEPLKAKKYGENTTIQIVNNNIIRISTIPHQLKTIECVDDLDFIQYKILQYIKKFYGDYSLVKLTDNTNQIIRGKITYNTYTRENTPEDYEEYHEIADTLKRIGLKYNLNINNKITIEHIDGTEPIIYENDKSR